MKLEGHWPRAFGLNGSEAYQKATPMVSTAKQMSVECMCKLYLVYVYIWLIPLKNPSKMIKNCQKTC